MKRTFLTLTLAMAATWTAAAPPSEASIQQLLDLTQSEAMLNQMYGSIEQIMRQGMRQAVAGRPLTPDQQKVLDLAPGKLASVLRSELNWSTLKADYVLIYQETFDQAEIDGLIAFYGSPAGKAFIAKMPAVMQKSIALSQARMQRYIPKVTQAMEEALREAGVQK